MQTNQFPKRTSVNKGVEKSNNKLLFPSELIEQKIFLVRSCKVMFDKDLACLYNISTFNLNKAVSRNLIRFPEDFMFRLTKDEYQNLIFHFGISRWGGTRKLPRAFTEHGILMLSSVLKNERAVFVNIAIMRAFVKLRQIVSRNKELEQKLHAIEHRIEKHDADITTIFNAIRQIIKEEQKPKGKIGFI